MLAARQGSGDPSSAVPADPRGEVERRIERLARRCGITQAERRVLCRLICGDTNLEIAERLGLSLGTVKGHVRSCLRRTEVENRQALTALVWAVDPEAKRGEPTIPTMLDGTPCIRKRDETKPQRQTSRYAVRAKPRAASEPQTSESR